MIKRTDCDKEIIVHWGGINWDTIVIAAILILSAIFSTWVLTKTIDRETKAIQEETSQILIKMLKRDSEMSVRRATLDSRLEALESGLSILTTQISDKTRTINQLQATVAAESKRKLEIITPIPVIVKKDTSKDSIASKKEK